LQCGRSGWAFACLKPTKAVFRNATTVHLDDGFKFKEVTSAPMERDLPYGGERFEISWTLFGIQNSEKLKIDVAAGDVVDPASMASSDFFLCPIDDESFSCLVYPPEFIIAEKLETMLRFGTGNTRVKDLIDLWSFQKMNIDISVVQNAVKKCFENRDAAFSIAEVESILTDTVYGKFVSDSIARNFGHLKLPSREVIFSDLIR
jgi:hypothetical protein